MNNSQQLSKRCGFEEALDLTGFGKYNVAMLISCALVLLYMSLDIVGVTISLPKIACELELTTRQQGFLVAASFIGILISSYAWGLCADTLGRRKTLLMFMPVGIIMSVITSFAPSFASLTTLKVLSSCFTSSASSAAFVLLGESVARKHRNMCIFLLMASSTMSAQFVAAALAYPVINLDFRVQLSWLSLEFTPWRLHLLLLCIPGLIGISLIAFLYESPKFLLSVNEEVQTLSVLKSIYSWNNKNDNDVYFHIDGVYLDDHVLSTQARDDSKISILRKIWNQTVPLFKPPLLKNSIIVFYLLISSYMMSAAYCMWVTYVTNAYLTGTDKTGRTFCDVARSIATTKNSTYSDCNNAIRFMTLYSVMIFSLGCTIAAILVSFINKLIGKKNSTLLVFACSVICGILLSFVTNHFLSIVLYYLFMYVIVILGNINSYIVELNPTHLRGMATCLSVVFTRSSGFVGIQLFASYLADYCIEMHIGFIAVVASGFLVSLLLPPDKKISILSSEAAGRVTNVENKSINK